MSRKSIATEVRFPCKVAIGDLAVSMAMEVTASKNSEAFADRFSIEAPPCGVLPLQVRVLGKDMKESRKAELTETELDLGIRVAAESELPGLSDSEAALEDGGARPWN